MDGNLENNQELNNLKGKVVMIPSVDKTLSVDSAPADAKTTGDELKARVKTADIVDNLNSTDADKPLSARQGNVIKKELEALTTSGAGVTSYDNTNSGLDATNMQSAIDEVVEKIDTVEADVLKNANNIDKITEDYVPKNGNSMIEGSISVRNADNGYATLNKNNSATADYGTQMVDTSADGKKAFLSISALLGTCTYTDPDGNIRDVHHEGSKPFVEYTGNGKATSRTIATKGIGRIALVYCSTHQALVTPKGAMVTDLSTGTFSWIDSGKVSFFNGNLVLGTANDAFNKSNETYYIQVI